MKRFRTILIIIACRKRTIKSHDFLARKISMRTSFKRFQMICKKPKISRAVFVLCNAGLRGKCTDSGCSCRMILHDFFNRRRYIYIARKPMQGIIMHGQELMHGKELMHGLSNAGKIQCRRKSNARLFSCTDSIMHENHCRSP